jgi:hypothetical protein
MLRIENLHATVDDKPILKGISLVINPGEIHAIMGPNGSGKSTLSYVLAGRPGYEVTEGSVTLDGEDLLELDPHERAAKGMFLGFQYPVEIPGVSNVQFLRTALNAQRRARGDKELSAGEFLRVAREQADALDLSMDMMKRGVNVGFSGGATRWSRWGSSILAWPSSTRPIPGSTSTLFASSAGASTGSCASPTRRSCSSPITSASSRSWSRTSSTSWPAAASYAPAVPSWRVSSSAKAMAR